MMRQLTHRRFAHSAWFARRAWPLVLLGALAVLIGCTPQSAIRVYITATPDLPTLTPTPISTLEPPPTLTPGNPNTPTRTPQIIGAVVSDDYTLEPSNTPRPTRTPLPTATPEITIPPRATRAPRVTNTPPGPTSTPFPVLSRDPVGVQVYANHGRDEWDFALSRATELGVTWIKVQVNWAFLQPNGANADETLMRLFELNMETADQRGFKIMLSIAKAPAWARPGAIGADAPPDNPAELANFINLLFTQTKIGGVADAIEIWNEPNLRREWNTSVLPFNGAGYMQLFGPAYDAIRSHRGDITIITAGLSPATTQGDFAVDDRVYLQQMYDNGLRNYIGDPNLVIGSHPYGWGNAPDARCCDTVPDRGWDDNPHFFFLENLDAVRDIMARNGHTNGQQWVTEFGWAVWDDIEARGFGLPDPAESYGWMKYTSVNQQVDYTVRALEIGQSRPDVGVMILWNLDFANPLTLQNRQEIVGYSLIFPPEREGADIVRRPLAFLLHFAFATPAP